MADSSSSSTSSNNNGPASSSTATTATTTSTTPGAAAAASGPSHLRDGIHKPQSPSSNSNTTASGGGTSSTPSSVSNSSGLNPRSCVTCRRRKVRCDKKHPCSNCQKAHIDCIFPAPGRAPRKPRKPPDAELLARLRRLEGVVQNLGVPVDEDGSASSQQGGDASQQRYQSQNQVKIEVPGAAGPQWNNNATHQMTGDFGRLVVNEGRSRYVNNTFWATLSSEVEDLKGILNESSDNDDENNSYPSPVTDPLSSPPHHGYMFNLSAQATDLSSLQPAPESIHEYWRVFIDNCDPVMKMLHIPTMSDQINTLIGNLGRISKGMEALMFGIYFTAVSSLTQEECQTRFGQSRDTLLHRYRFALEQALAKAHFLVTDEIIVLQAFILLLASLRRDEDPRAIWSLCGLATRIALTLGLHRDGANFGLAPFEIEIRRRTWWHIVLLDYRASEDHGCDPAITESSYDTHLPLNVHDSDLSPNMTALPPERAKTITAMTFCLIRFEICNTFRPIYARNGSKLQLDSLSEVMPQEKEKSILNMHQHIEEKYLKHCQMNVPMHWVISTVARLIMAKQWLVLYHPGLRADRGSGLSSQTLERLFVVCLESLEFRLALESERKAVPWGWMFNSFQQWHAFVFVLSELKRRTKGPLVNRAWRAVDASVMMFGNTDEDTKKGHIWKPLRRLLVAARKAREQELTNERRNPQQQQQHQQQQQQTQSNHLPIRPNTASPIHGAAPSLTPSSLPDAPFDASNPHGIPGQFPLPFPPPPGSATGTTSPGPSNNANASSNNYIWDSFADSPAMPTSTFFQNQPQIQPQQWTDIANSNLHAPHTLDWLEAMSSELRSPGGSTTNTMTGTPSPGISAATFDPSSNTIFPAGGAGAPGVGGTGPGSQAASTMNRSNTMGSEGLPSAAGGDPMMGGSDDGTGGQMGLADWDVMMREFGMQGGVQHPGGVSSGYPNHMGGVQNGSANAGGGAMDTSGGGGGEWGRSMARGETWL